MNNQEKLVLIIEDDEFLIELISDKIIESGYKTICFSKGQEALDWLKSNTPFLFVLDYGLPDFSGDDFVTELKSAGVVVPPFIMATGQGDERIAVKMMRLGARDYLIKDVYFMDRLPEVVNRVRQEIDNEEKIKLAEEEILRIKNHYQTIIEKAPDGFVLLSEFGEYKYLSPSARRIFGYHPNDNVILDPSDATHPEDLSMVLTTLAEIISDASKIPTIQYRFAHKKGEWIWIESTFSNLLADPNVASIVINFKDITERKAAENYLISSKAILKNLVYFTSGLIESSPAEIDFFKFTDKIKEITGAKYAAFNIFDPDGYKYRTIAFSGIPDYIDISKKYLKFDISNKTWEHDTIREAKIKDNTITKFDSIFDLIGHTLPEAITSLINITFHLGEAYVVRISKNDIQEGDFTLLFEKGETLQNPEIAELYANQVALFIERFKTEKNLKESENKFRILFAENPQPMWVYDLQTLKILEVNDATLCHYGYSREEFLALSVIQLHPKEFIPEFMQLIDKSRKGINTDGISQHIKKNGDVISVEIHSNHVSSFGEHARLIMVNDITLQKKAEDDLITSLSLLNATLESTADGILVVDLEGIATIYNQKFVEMWNIPQNLLDEKTDEQLLRYVFTQIEDPEIFINKVNHLYKNQELSSSDILILKDARTFERFSLPQKVGNKIMGRVWSFRDITTRISAENNLQTRIEEMTRFHKLTVGRELTMIELKKELNNLLEKVGQEAKYVIVE